MKRVCVELAACIAVIDRAHHKELDHARRDASGLRAVPALRIGIRACGERFIIEIPHAALRGRKVLQRLLHVGVDRTRGGDGRVRFRRGSLLRTRGFGGNCFHVLVSLLFAQERAHRKRAGHDGEYRRNSSKGQRQTTQLRRFHGVPPLSKFAK